MRKTLIVLALLVFVLPLSAYSVHALDSTVRYQSRTEMRKTKKTLQRNRKIWKKSTAKADVISSDGFDSENEYVSTSLDQLKNHNQALIKGTVYKLQKMSSPQNMAYTKTTIHVDKVISGDRTLQGRDVYVAFSGGLVSFDRWYANMSKPKDSNHEIFVKNDEFPMPSIGSKVITGLVPNHLDEATEYNDSLKQSGFTIKNSYALDIPRYNFWIKRPKDKRYKLNNPKIVKKNNDLTKELQKLTKQINRKYNHM